MSEQPTAPARNSGNVFTRKIGPLPMWVWMLIILVAAGGYYLIRKGSSTSTSNNQASANTPGGVDASLVPQFVNQTYTNVQPPPAPNITVNNRSGPPGPSALQETFSKGHVISPSAKKATVGWTNTNVGGSGATQLKIGIDGPGLGPGGSDSINPVYRYIPASATTATFENLKPGHNYTVTILPVDAKGHAVGPPGYVDLKTKLWQIWARWATAMVLSNSWWRPVSSLRL